jgi:hypothetical protein
MPRLQKDGGWQMQQENMSDEMSWCDECRTYTKYGCSRRNCPFTEEYK